MEKIYFTEAGFQSFLARIKKDEDRIREMSSRLGYLAEVGGDQYHDNFSYEQQVRDLNMLSDKIKKDRMVLAKASIIDEKSKRNPGIVFINSVVTAEIDKKTESWQIVGYGESDPGNHKLAYNTPLGAAFMGRCKGDIFSSKVGSRIVNITILKIE